HTDDTHTFPTRRSSDLVTTGTIASPASPASRKPTATSWNVVFHFASRVTGTLTRSSARYSRRPETRISRHRITIAAHSDQPRMVDRKSTRLNSSHLGIS